MKQKLSYIVCLLLLSFFNCKKEAPVMVDSPLVEDCIFEISFDQTPLVLDQETNTFFYAVTNFQAELSVSIEFNNEPISVLINDIEITNESTFTFENLHEKKSIQVTNCGEHLLEYQICFSTLPIIDIQRNGIFIWDDPKQAVDFRLLDPNYLENGTGSYLFSATIGIETRGGSAQIYPKKSYGFELWEDTTGQEKFDATLLGMRDDDDWILDAMYIDKSKMRNRISMDIWATYNQLDYLVEEPEASNAVNGKFVEVFIDNKYNGIYALNERMDRKQLQLESSDEGDIEGLLYKATIWGDGIVTFDTFYPPAPFEFQWDGWLQKHPEPEDLIYWDELESFVQFVIESDNSTFTNSIHNYLLLENAVDYFILLNLIRGDDNRGKNIYMGRYDEDSPFFMTPWDMDATWGRDFIAFETSTTGILSNHLFDRILENDPDNFRERLKQRWTELRINTLSTQAIHQRFDNHKNLLINSNAFEREKIRWEFDYDLESEILFIKSWIDTRMFFLDDYFENL